MYQEFWDACENGDIDKINKIVSQITDINKSNSKGWNAIILAAYNHNLEIVKILLKYGANINSINQNGTTVFMYAKTKVLENNNFALLDFLIESGSDINRKDFKNNWTVLDYVKQTNNHQLITYLINKGAL
jgi:ankyrin repeat protein